MQSLWTKWVKANKKKFERSTVFELKITKKKRLPFSRIEEHQINSLLNASIGDGDYHKISDQSMDMKPWDCQLIKKADAYIVILFYQPRKPKEYILIDIKDMVDFIKKSKMKSVTEEEAKLLSSYIVTI